MTPLQIAFCVISPLIVLFVIFVILYKPLSRVYTRKHFKKSYYKRVYKTTLYGDYFLINDFLFFHEDNKTTTVDHLMLGEKYIYVIKDYYFDGSIKGDGNDKSLVLLKNDKNHTKMYIDNPIIDLRNTVKRLSMVTNIDLSMMIGIAVVNDDCNIDVNLVDNEYYIVQADNFEKLIRAIESRPIETINQEQLQNVVNDLDRLNRKGKKHAKTNI